MKAFTLTLLLLTVMGSVIWGLNRHETVLQMRADRNVEPTAWETTLELYRDTWGTVISIDVHCPGCLGLVNNVTAVNPTWAELVDFLAEDKTDQNTYVPDEYVCLNFATDLHNNAERAGIRAGLVTVELSEVPRGHAFNAFKTTDRGLVFIDCVGVTDPQPGKKYCRSVEAKLGTHYMTASLFRPEDSWFPNTPIPRLEFGTILGIEIYW